MYGMESEEQYVTYLRSRNSDYTPRIGYKISDIIKDE